ncbi:MAG: cupin [Daejeonella sp.]|nr:cupin [Daejeonella sp.]
MKVITVKTALITAFAFAMLISQNANSQTTKPGEAQTLSIFPKGELGPAKNFTGKAWNIGLVTNDTTYQTIVGNVFFEPGARSNWHTHPSGQILIITDGVGYYQEKGEPKKIIKKGDVVKCLPNVMHWHGASSKSGMQQMYILPKTEKGIVKWLHPVSDQEYNGL